MSDNTEDLGLEDEGIENVGAASTEAPPEQVSERDRIAAQREADLLAEAGHDETAPDIQEAPQEPLKAKIKVDGEEEEVDVDDLVKNYQKYEAGDRRLREAALAKQQLDEERARFEQEKLNFLSTNQPPLPIQAPTQEDVIAELKAARREALEIADYDEFDRLDDEINNLRTASIPNPNDVVNQATRNAIVQMQYESAFDNFKNNNVDIISDPVLYNITMGTFNNMCKDSSTYQEAFAKTEKVMKEWISSVAGVVKTNAGDAAMATRQAKKDSIPNEPGRVNAKLTPPPAQKEETASEIIANMRKARGLPV